MTLLIVVALVAAATILAPATVRLCDRKAGWPLGLVLAAGAVILGRRLPEVLDGQPLHWEITWIRDFLHPGNDIIFSLHGDSISVFFALLALSIGAVVFIYSAAYLPAHKGNTNFYTIMSAFTLSVLLLVLAGDVFVLFAAWELVSIASFMLIARSGSKAGVLGSMRTLQLTFFGGLTLLAGLAIAAVSAGSTSIQEILASDVWGANAVTTTVAILIALSAFTKAAQFPFHFWLPEAMAAATPVSAFLHAAAVVKAGVYLLIRFSEIFADNTAWQVLLIASGLLTACYSALFAIQKTDLKHLTAYSTVSHLGWIVATIGVGTELAIAAALTHTLAHALFKSSLFMLIGVIDHQTGVRDISQLGNMWRQMPFTFASTIVAAASMAAVPPLFGFVSKESMLIAFESVSIWLLLLAGVAALLTFLYSAKIVFGAFIDGDDDMSHVKEAPVSLWLPAALPGWMSVVAIFALAPLSELTGASLSLWHGITPPLIVSVAVLIIGAALLTKRAKIFGYFQGHDFLPFNGNEALYGIINGSRRYGRALAAMADSFSPGRHLLWIIIMVLALGGSTLALTTGVDGVALAPQVEGLTNYWDLVPLAFIALGVLGLMVMRSRMAAAVMLSAIGIGMSLQFMLLGAPDVATTQFLVEAITIIFIFMVLRYQPRLFPKVERSRTITAAILAVLTGIITFIGVHALLGRRGRSELAHWFIDNTYDVGGGTNIVAIILVEFRSFDTLGELSVLGMAAVVIAAVTQSIKRQPLGPQPQDMSQPELNSIPLRQATRLITPVLIVLSVLIFLRGHSVPGGGFVAALVLATAFGLVYLSQGRDKPVVGEKTPIYLTGVGIVIALASGFLGFLEGGFLYMIHGYVAGEHLTTSLVFDLGIYLAVLGMVTQAINSLGGKHRPGAPREDEEEAAAPTEEVHS